MNGSTLAADLKLAAKVWAATTLCFALAYLLGNEYLNLDAPGGFRSLCQWDCLWYQGIAESGYDTAPRVVPARLMANYAFWPAFPALAALVMKISGLGFLAAGLLVNAAAAFVFCWLTIAAAPELGLKSKSEAAWFLAAFLVSPWGIHNHVPYTEMLFNLGLLGAFVLWRRQRYVGAALFGILITSTRITGIFLPLILLADLALRERSRIWRLFWAPDARVRALAAMPLGFVGFSVYLYFHTGDPMAFLRIQEFGWGHGLGNPLGHLAAAFVGDAAALYAATIYVLACALLAIGVWGGRIPGPLAAFAWAAPSVILLSTVYSLPRYALALFPVYLLVPALPVWARWTVLAVFGIAEIVFVSRWLDGAAFLV